MENCTFKDAYFFDNDRTVIKVTWTLPEGRDIFENIPANENNARYKYLMETIEPMGGIDSLHDRTYEYIKETQQSLQDDIISIGKANGLIMDLDVVNTDVYKVFCKVMFEKTETEKEEKEKLFMFKLALFEQDTIRQSSNRELKAKLRKAESVLDALKVAIEIAQD